MMTEDLGVFFDTDDFASVCTRQRAGTPDVPFNGIVGVVDQDALQGYAITAEHYLTYPTAAVALLEGDHISVTGPLGVSQLWKVRREPTRVEDGNVSHALLSKVG